MELIVEMDLERSTKNTHVYTAPKGTVAVDTLYISKALVEGTAPKSIKVVITDA